jgi:hypothetical protein
MNLMKKIFWGTAITIFNIGTALADGGPIGTGGQITLQNPLGTQSLADIVAAILSAFFTLSIPIVSIMVMVGGYYILTAAGNEENLKKGRQTITYAVIGFAVILLANGVVSLVRELLKI